MEFVKKGDDRMNSAGYRKGQHYVICDSCGLRGWSGQMVTRWDGKLVHNNTDCHEPRHPQDMIEISADRQTVEGVRNPPDVFLNSGDVTPGSL